jgi:hypothetical protein
MGLLELRGFRKSTYITETGKEIVLTLPIEQLILYIENYFYVSKRSAMIIILQKAMQRLTTGELCIYLVHNLDYVRNTAKEIYDNR